MTTLKEHLESLTYHFHYKGVDEIVCLWTWALAEKVAERFPFVSVSSSPGVPYSDLFTHITEGDPSRRNVEISDQARYGRSEFEGVCHHFHSSFPPLLDWDGDSEGQPVFILDGSNEFKLSRQNRSFLRSFSEANGCVCIDRGIDHIDQVLSAPFAIGEDGFGINLRAVFQRPLLVVGGCSPLSNIVRDDQILKLNGCSCRHPKLCSQTKPSECQGKDLGCHTFELLRLLEQYGEDQN